MASCVTRAPNPRPRQSWHILRQQNTISLHRSTMETRKPPSWSRNPIDPSGLDRPPTISCYMHCMRPDAIWIFSSGTQRFPFSRIYTFGFVVPSGGVLFLQNMFSFSFFAFLVGVGRWVPLYQRCNNDDDVFRNMCPRFWCLLAGRSRLPHRSAGRVALQLPTLPVPHF